MGKGSQPRSLPRVVSSSASCHVSLSIVYAAVIYVFRVCALGVVCASSSFFEPVSPPPGLTQTTRPPTSGTFLVHTNLSSQSASQPHRSNVYDTSGLGLHGQGRAGLCAVREIGGGTDVTELLLSVDCSSPSRLSDTTRW